MPVEMEILDTADSRNSSAEAMDGDSMWEDENENEKPKSSQATLAWRCPLWAGMKIANKLWIHVGQEEIVVNRCSVRGEGMSVGRRNSPSS
jgi:hypothetical protein